MWRAPHDSERLNQPEQDEGVLPNIGQNPFSFSGAVALRGDSVTLAPLRMTVGDCDAGEQ
jgi:hypothetical protein